MATSLVDPHARVTYPAGSAALAQFLFVALNGSEQLVLPGAGGVAIGILDDSPSLAAATLGADDLYSGGFTVGRYYGIVVRGLMKVRASANIAAQAPVMTDAAGKALTATATNVILGVAMHACASGDLVQVNLSSLGAVHA